MTAAIAGGTKIEWTDFSFNPWWGCERVSPACAHCYADTFAKRVGQKDLWTKTGEHGFRWLSDANWAKPLKWARTAPAKLGRRPRVFCASMADVFEDRPELAEPRKRLFALIEQTPELDWLVLTKRPENVVRLADRWTGYRKADAASSTRELGLRSGDGRRVGDRLAGSDLAGQEAHERSLDGQDAGDAMRSGESGVADGPGVSSGSPDAGRREGLRERAPAGVAAPQRPDSGGPDGEPQERGEGRQQALELGARDLQRAATPRDQGARSDASRRAWGEASEDASDGRGRHGNAPAPCERRDGEDDRGGIRNDAQGDVGDLSTRDLEALALGHWPPNVWLGVSIENARFTWRADVLREIPAAVRFISAEPLLGSLFPLLDCDCRANDWTEGDNGAIRCTQCGGYAGEPGTSIDVVPVADRPPANTRRAPLDLTGIDWVIVGGESGPKARPFHLEHAREILREAQALCDANCEYDPAIFTHDECSSRPAVFVKQLGAKPVGWTDVAVGEYEERPLKLLDSKGGDITEWPADLRIREFPRSAA